MQAPGSHGYYASLERASTPLAFREQICNMVSSRKDQSERDFASVRARLPRLYDLWRGYYTGQDHPFKNNVHIPFIFSVVESDVARKMAASFSTWPVVRMLGYGPNDGPTSRKQEALVSAWMKDYGAFKKETLNIKAADLFGTSITQLGWDTKSEMATIVDSQASPLTGEMIRQIRREQVVTFDGPNLELVNRLDAFPQWGFQSIDGMKWFIRRYFLDIDDCRALAAFGTFDKGELARLEREGMGPSSQVTEDYGISQYRQRAGIDDLSVQMRDPYFRPVEILEMWGVVPSEFATDGETNRVVTVANRQFLMRNKPNPFWHRRKPFHVFSPTMDPFYFDAPGKAEVAEKLQIVSNRFVNQTLDVTDLVADPMSFFDRNSGLKTRGLYARPGRFIPMDGNPNERIMPYQPDLRGVQLASGKVQEMWQYLQMGTGILDDAVMGLQGSDRQTAREFVGRREAAGTRLQNESRIYEEMYLEPLANQMVALGRQFLTKPVEVLLLGEAADTDQITGRPIAVGREWVSNMDMLPNYTARAFGATTSLSRGERKQDMLTLLQTVAPIAAQMGAVNMMNFIRQVFVEFQVPNASDMMSEMPMMQELQSMAQSPAVTQQQPGLSQGGLPEGGMQELMSMVGAA